MGWTDQLVRQLDWHRTSQLRPRLSGLADVEYFCPFAELVLHINREMIHHGAEIALLRDLYRATRQSNGPDNLQALP